MDILRRWLARLRAWRYAKVRYIGWGPKPLVPYHITFTPHFGFALPLPLKRGRLRWARHHGLQIVIWDGRRWKPSRQLIGRSKVVGEQWAKDER